MSEKENNEQQSGDVKEKEGQQNEMLQFLTFHLAEEEYGLDIMQVLEIRGWSETTRLPNTPDFVLGIINLRGVVVPVIDLRARFNMEAAKIDEKSVVIILSSAERSLGVLVDNVSDILDVQPNHIQPPPQMSSGIESDFLHGLAAIKDRMVVLLSTEKLFSMRLLDEVHKLIEQEQE